MSRQCYQQNLKSQNIINDMSTLQYCTASDTIVDADHRGRWTHFLVVYTALSHKSLEESKNLPSWGDATGISSRSYQTRSSANAEEPREHAASGNVVKCCTNVWSCEWQDLQCSSVQQSSDWSWACPSCQNKWLSRCPLFHMRQGAAQDYYHASFSTQNKLSNITTLKHM